MIRNNIMIFCIMVGLVFSSCLKQIDIPQTNNITVTLRNSSAGYLSTDATVNPKDSIFLDYSVSSSNNTNMKFVIVQKNGADIFKDTLAVPATTFSTSKKFLADSASGVYTYNILAKDAAGIYLGSKKITVTVSPDFVFYSVRVLQVPDSLTKINKCYFSTTNGQSYSWSFAGTNSSLIDFGYFYDTTRVLAGSPAVLTPKGHTIYALNNTITPFLPYDISTWTQNATLLKLSTSVSFASLTSSGSLKTAGLAALGSGTVTRISTTDRATASQSSHLTGAVILFKTAAGKFGALNVNYTNNNGASPTSYINFDVKVQK
jgi:hypothetical protein